MRTKAPLRKSVFFYLFLAVILLLIFQYLFSFIHENAHRLFAIMLGVKSSDIQIVILSILPHTIIPEGALTEVNSRLFRSSGGFTAGVFGLIIYGLILWFWCRKNAYNPSHLSSWIGLLILLIAVFELLNGIVEGRFLGLYIRTEYAVTAALLSLFIAHMIHFSVTPFRGKLIPYITYIKGKFKL